MERSTTDAGSGIVTLLTDFGTEDSYVASMKGVILSRCPTLRIVDITHDVPPQDILRAALVLAECMFTFPPGTVHVVVVDPGVGTERGSLVAVIDEQVVVAPDNGLVAIARRRSSRACFYRLDRDDLTLPGRSATFHGRDVYAPVGAALAMGAVSPASVGPPVEPVALVLPETRAGERCAAGTVIGVDRFGNLTTTVSGEVLLANAGTATVRVGGVAVDRVVRTYGEGPSGALVALVGSSGFLEVAAVRGSAARTLGAGRGAMVEVIW